MVSPIVSKVAISNVIISHNRRDLLLAHLKAIPAQTMPPDRYEVIAVCDACSDGSFDAVCAFQRDAPYRLIVDAVDECSRSRARNAGAAHASGRILVFNDDDCLPYPSLFSIYAAHVDADNAGMGYISANNDRRQRTEPDARMLFVTRNVAVAAATFRRIGGFDEQLTAWGHEDHDLACRFVDAGVELRYLPEAKVLLLWHELETEIRSLDTNLPYLEQKYGAWPPPELQTGKTGRNGTENPTIVR